MRNHYSIQRQTTRQFSKL